MKFNLKRKLRQTGFCFQCVLIFCLLPSAALGLDIKNRLLARGLSDRLMPLIIILNPSPTRKTSAWWLGCFVVTFGGLVDIRAHRRPPALCVHHFFIRLLQQRSKGVQRMLFTRRVSTLKLTKFWNLSFSIFNFELSKSAA